MARLTTLGAAAVIFAIGGGATAVAQEFEQDWTGFYAGVHVDGTAYTVEMSDLNDQFLAEPPESAFLLAHGGLTGGYNYMLEPGLLISGELDWTSALVIDNFIASNTDETTGVQYDLSLENLIALRGRVGFVRNNAVGYMTAGITQASTKFEVYQVNTGAGQTACDNTTCSSTSEPLLGVAIGGGVDWAFRENWVGRLEVQHMAFESIQVPVQNAAGNPSCGAGETDQCTMSFEPATTSIRVGITYMFE